jgi:hypothetical protein
VNVNLRKRLQQRKRRLLTRIDKSHIPSTPAIDTPTLELQLAYRTQAISAGGRCPILQMIKTLDLHHHINSCIPIFKVYAPYDEADNPSPHVPCDGPKQTSTLRRQQTLVCRLCLESLLTVRPCMERDRLHRHCRQIRFGLPNESM